MCFSTARRAGAASAGKYVGMSGDATVRGGACLEALEEAGRRAGLEVQREYAVPGGRVDLVWLWRPDSALPGVTATLPVVGFEVESSSRTRARGPTGRILVEAKGDAPTPQMQGNSLR